MKNRNVVLVDADALIGLIKPADVHHERVKFLLMKMKEKNMLIRIPVTAAGEAITMLHIREDNPLVAESLNEMVKRGDLPIVDVTKDIALLATDIFSADRSKKNTFFDAILIAIYRKTGAGAILSFDAWYKKQGCIMLEDVIDE